MEKNLSLSLSEQHLENIANYVLQCIKRDEETNSAWVGPLKKAEKQIINVDEIIRNSAENILSSVGDPTLVTGLIRFHATVTPELFPEGGPASFNIAGESNEQLEEMAKVRAAWLNYHLTIKDKEYFRDYQRFIIYLAFYGLAVRKVYFDEMLNGPISRFIMPEDFLFNADSITINDSDRLTHVLRLSSREIKYKRDMRIYDHKVELEYLKNHDDPGGDEIKCESGTLHKIYECHIYLDLNSFKDYYSSSDKELAFTKPYIITIDNETGKILRIVKNWDENDPVFKRRNYFVIYNYLPGFNIRGIGLGELCGGLSRALETSFRMLLDAGVYQNIPCFIATEGIPFSKKNISLKPGEIISLGSGNIRNSIMQLPFSGPSPGLMQSYESMRLRLQELISNTELGLMETKDTPATATAIAIFEEKNKQLSAIMKGIVNCFSEELALIDKMFCETINQEQFVFEGNINIINPEYFVSNVQISAVAKPILNTSMIRIKKAEMLYNMAQSNPDKFNITEAAKELMVAMEIDKNRIDKIIPQESELEPLDPITENINMQLGKAVTAGIEQNHDAHIVLHTDILNTQQISSNVAAQIQAHIQEHVVLKYKLEMQNDMANAGIEPGEYDLNDPAQQYELESRIAAMVLEERRKEEETGNKPITENDLLMRELDIQERGQIMKKQTADEKNTLETARLSLENLTKNKELDIKERKLALEEKKEGITD